MGKKYIGCLVAVFISLMSIGHPKNTAFIKPVSVTADFTYSPDTIYAGTNVTFSATAISNVYPVQFRWDWGDNSDSVFTASNIISHTYFAPGAYQVRLVVVNVDGESDTVIKSIAILELPANNLIARFTFSPDTLFVPATVQFINMSTTSSGVIVSYIWDFGDGMQSSTLQNPVHTYVVNGSYSVSLTVANSLGEVNTYFRFIFIRPPANEQKISLCPSVDSTQLNGYFSGANYQWQLSTDSGITYSNITDNANYTGTNQRLIQLKNIPSSWAGYKYRCITDGNNMVWYKIVFSNSFAGSINSSWENPANWGCSNAPDANTDVVIPTGSTVVLNSNVSCGTITVSPGASFTISPGFTLTVTH